MFKKSIIAMVISFVLTTVFMSFSSIISNRTYAKYVQSAEFYFGFPGEVFNLDYEIWFVDKDGNVINGFLDSNGVIEREDNQIVQSKDGQDGQPLKITDNNTVIDGNSLNSVFGSGRLQKIYNNSFYYYVTILGQYTAQIYLNDDKRNPDVMTKVEGVNGTWDLGTEPVFDRSGNPDLTQGPEMLNLSYAGFRNGVRSDHRVIVKLCEKSDPPTFDASAWLDTTNARKRGTTGTSVADRGDGNIVTVDEWNWNNSSSELAKGEQQMTPNGDGSYSYVWVWQTNSEDEFILDSFEVNGVACKIPFKPLYNNSVLDDSLELDDYSKTTVLLDGSTVTITLYRRFTSGNNPQRVYEMRFDNVHSKKTVTGGNIMMYRSGAPEFVLYEANPTVGNYVLLDGIEHRVSYPFVEHSLDAVDFTLKSFYEDPKIIITDMHGDILFEKEAEKVNKDDNLDFAYHIDTKVGLDNSNNGRQNLNTKLVLIYITATPMKFAVKYWSGLEVPDATMDHLDERYEDGQTTWFDDNLGNYYTVENDALIVVNDKNPMDANREDPMVFKSWYVGAGEGLEEVRRDQVFTFDYLAVHSRIEMLTLDDETQVKIHVINFYAQWWPKNQITWEEVYNIYCDEWAEMSMEEWYESCWQQWAPFFWDEWTSK